VGGMGVYKLGRRWKVGKVRRGILSWVAGGKVGKVS